MPAHVRFDMSGFESKFTQSNVRMGRLAAAGDAHQAMEQFVPKRSGDLRSYSNVNTDGSDIVYAMPYARRQFYLQAPASHYREPGTSGRWDLRLKGDQQLMNKVTEAFVKGANWNGS
jgi:Minor capsid.